MKFVKFIGRDGKSADYPDYGKAVPPYPKSNYITAVRLDEHRYHWGEGDMWPVTWGADDSRSGVPQPHAQLVAHPVVVAGRVRGVADQIIVSVPRDWSRCRNPLGGGLGSQAMRRGRIDNTGNWS